MGNVDVPPEHVQSDRGGEFAFFEKKNSFYGNKVNLNFSSNYEMKAAIIERVIRTLKKMIGGVLFGIYGKDIGRYMKFLDLIVERYNESEHSSLGGKCPRDVYHGNVVLPKSFLYRGYFDFEPFMRKDSILKEGDKVRVSVMKSLFSKESRLNWSRTVYVINYVRLTDPVTYRLIDGDGEIVSGLFYRKELKKSIKINQKKSFDSVVFWIEGMNLLLSSNQISDRRDNRTNDFEIDIQPPLDTHYGNYYIRVNKFMYQMISMIHVLNREDFSCLPSLKFSNYMLHTNGNYLDGKVEFQMDEFLIPNGNYSKLELFDYLNRKLYYFGIYFGETVGKHFVQFEKDFEFFSGSKILAGRKTIDGYSSSSFVKKLSSKNSSGHDKFGILYKLEFGPGLSHVLGFEKNVVEFTVKLGTSKTNLFGIVESEGLNFIFVDCEQVEPVQLGFTYRSNLLVCPIGVQGGSGTVSYSPSGHERKLKSGVIDRIYITVNDINENRIFFNSGKVLLNCSMISK